MNHRFSIRLFLLLACRSAFADHRYGLHAFQRRKAVVFALRILNGSMGDMFGNLFAIMIFQELEQPYFA